MIIFVKKLVPAQILMEYLVMNLVCRAIFEIPLYQIRKMPTTFKLYAKFINSPLGVKHPPYTYIKPRIGV